MVSMALSKKYFQIICLMNNKNQASIEIIEVRSNVWGFMF